MGAWWKLFLVVNHIVINSTPHLLATDVLVKDDEFRHKRSVPTGKCWSRDDLLSSLDTRRYHYDGNYKRLYLVQICWGQSVSETGSNDQVSGCPYGVSECFFGSEVEIIACGCKVWSTFVPGINSYYNKCTEILFNAPQWRNEEASRLANECRPPLGDHYIPSTLNVKDEDYCSSGRNQCSPGRSVCRPIYGNYECACTDDYVDTYGSNDGSNPPRRGVDCRKEESDTDDKPLIEALWVRILIGLSVLVVLLVFLFCVCSSHCSRCVQKIHHLLYKDDQAYVIAEELQKLIGLLPEIKVKKFKNWASTQVVKGALTVRPRSVEEVHAVVIAAGKLGLEVRATGEKHSWTPMFHSDVRRGIIMYVGNIERPCGAPRIELSQDATGTYVTFAPAVTTGEFMQFQLNHGVIIPANVVLREVTMGGVIAGACHGVGRDVQTVSDSVVGMRVVDGHGVLRTYSMQQDPDMMRALQCNLGLWGIMTEITIKVEPMRIVHTQNLFFKVRDIFYNKENLKNIVNGNWSVEMFWFPFTGISKWEAVEALVQKRIDDGEWDPLEDVVYVRLVNNAVSTEMLAGDQVYDAINMNDLRTVQLYDKVNEFLAKYPHVAPFFLQSQLSTLKSIYDGHLTQHLPHAIHFRDYIESVPLNCMEWAFCVDQDFNNICYASQRTVELVYAEARQGRFPVNLALDMRFVADSNAYLAPAVCGNRKYGGTGLTCYIEILTSQGTPGWEDFCTMVYYVWRDLHGAKPHWCKMWSFLPDIDNFIRQTYRYQLPKFLAALERSGADPHGMFLTSCLEKIFYPHGHPGKHRHQQNTGMLLEMKDDLNVHY